MLCKCSHSTRLLSGNLLIVCSLKNLFVDCDIWGFAYLLPFLALKGFNQLKKTFSTLVTHALFPPRSKHATGLVLITTQPRRRWQSRLNKQLQRLDSCCAHYPDLDSLRKSQHDTKDWGELCNMPQTSRNAFRSNIHKPEQIFWVIHQQDKLMRFPIISHHQRWTRHPAHFHSLISSFGDDVSRLGNCRDCKSIFEVDESNQGRAGRAQASFPCSFPLINSVFFPGTARR